MTARTDNERVLTGVPVDIEEGATPGAVAKLRAELRRTAAELPTVAMHIRDCQGRMSALIDEQAIYRTACDELIDAIEALGGATRQEPA